MKILHALGIVAAFAAVQLAARTPEEEWKAFRSTYPLHIQTIALSAPAADGSRVLIVSEPPPHVTLAEIKEVGAAFSDVKVMKHTVGYGGWVKDVLCRVSGDGPTVNAAMSKLNRLLFGTSYKPYTLDLPATTVDTPLDIDLRISYSDVQTWLNDPDSRFELIGGGAPRALKELGKLKNPLVALSEKPGLVLLWLPKGTVLSKHRGVLRQFALDSDLIVGGQRIADGTLIAARERVAPVEVLPPLRAESIVLLFEANKEELEQSYERNHPLAGRISDASDWAPILLSQELRDTEYGSLLNITDQLLKGWSNIGQTHYVNFPYPTPQKWFFPAPLPKYLDVKQITYNWNTTGAGYTVENNGIETYALNRTGVLPVSYIPGADQAALNEENAPQTAKLREAEERAYAGFAATRDPNLCRVVQYAALYQIFRWSYGTGAKRETDDATKLLEKEFVALIKGIGAYDDATRILIATKIKARAIEYIGENYVPANFEVSVAKNLEEMKAFANAADSKTLEQVCRVLELPREAIAQSVARVEFGKTLIFFRSVLPLLAMEQDLPKRYSQMVDQQSKATWIHTPAIVVSGNSGDLSGGKGGHNLDSTISKFCLSDLVPAGTVKTMEIDGKTMIFVNPKDAGRVSELVRSSGKLRKAPEKLVEQLTRELPTIAARAPRQMAEALHLPAGWKADGVRGLALGNGSGNGRLARGWAVDAAPPPAALSTDYQQVHAIQPTAIVIERGANGAITVVGGSGRRAIMAGAPEDAVDAVATAVRGQWADGEPVYVHMSGFTPQEGVGMLQTLRLRDAKGTFRGRTVATAGQNGRMTEIVARNLDFANARTVIKQHQAKNGFDLAIEIPRRNATAQAADGHYEVTGKFRRQLEDSKLTTVLKKSAQKTRELLTGVASKESQRAAILDDINASLHSVAIESGEPLQSLQGRLKIGTQDVYIVFDFPAPDRASHLAGQLLAGDRDPAGSGGISD